MDAFEDIVGTINGLVWGPFMLVAILGTGLFLMVSLRFMPLLNIRRGFKLMGQKPDSREGAQGDITPFAALMTALAATVGTGNIVGVAAALLIGGPGALFWMWITALVGMATKYSEVVLAVHFREKDANGQMVGGPMYAIKNGLGARWAWIGFAFAIFGGLAGFGIGNMVQTNAIAINLDETFAIKPWQTGIVLTLLSGLVLLGGIKSIGRVASALVPFMCVAYIAGAIGVIVVNIDQLPGAVSLVFASAFSPAAATGGFAGAAIILAIQMGVARGVFSNEAGLGTAGIAQAAGITNSPVRSGLIGMMGTFIDTIIVCSLTGFAILTSGLWTMGRDAKGVVTSLAFDGAFPGVGQEFVVIGLCVFAFTTVLGWAYYSEKCWEFLIGEHAILPFRIVWVFAIFAGTVFQDDLVWNIADTLNGMMAIPNLICLIALSGVVVALTREHFAKD